MAGMRLGEIFLLCVIQAASKDKVANQDRTSLHLVPFNTVILQGKLLESWNKSSTLRRKVAGPGHCSGGFESKISHIPKDPWKALPSDASFQMQGEEKNGQ